MVYLPYVLIFVLFQDLKNGKFLAQNNTTFNKGQQISFECKKGYSSKGINYSICQNDGTWSHGNKTLCNSKILFFNYLAATLWLNRFLMFQDVISNTERFKIYPIKGHKIKRILEIFFNLKMAN